MKKVNKTVVLTWILSVAPLILVAAMYGRLPDKVPSNWGLNGEVSYQDKSMLWIIAGTTPVLAAMLVLLPKIDPRRRNYEKFQGFYDAFCLIMMLFMLGMVALVVSESLNPGRISVSSVVCAACGLLFVFLGNMMPKVKSNFFVGARTPWALSSSEVWNKTNRLSGYLFFFGGIVITASAFFLDDVPLFITMMSITAVASIVPAVMSFVWYQKLPPSEKEN